MESIHYENNWKWPISPWVLSIVRHSWGISYNYGIFIQPYLHNNKTHLIRSKQNLAQNKPNHTKRSRVQTVIGTLVSVVSASALRHCNKPSPYLSQARVQPTFCITSWENVHSVQDTVIMGGGGPDVRENLSKVNYGTNDMMPKIRWNSSGKQRKHTEDRLTTAG